MICKWLRKLCPCDCRKVEPVAVEKREVPGWMKVAKAEIGTAEIRGSEDNPRIVEYHEHTSLKAQDDETPWCMAFVNWVLFKCMLLGTGRANARSVVKSENFIKLDGPVYGCIVVFWRESPESWKGHVAFFEELVNNNVMALGGNQGNEVSIKAYPKSRVLGYYWPKDIPVPKEIT